MNIPKEIRRIADELDKLSSEIAKQAIATADLAEKEGLADLSDDISSLQSKLRTQYYWDATYFFDEN